MQLLRVLGEPFNVICCLLLPLGALYLIAFSNLTHAQGLLQSAVCSWRTRARGHQAAPQVQDTGASMNCVSVACATRLSADVALCVGTCGIAELSVLLARSLLE